MAFSKFFNFPEIIMMELFVVVMSEVEIYSVQMALYNCFYYIICSPLQLIMIDHYTNLLFLILGY